jgi:hypothetical protein
MVKGGAGARRRMDYFFLMDNANFNSVSGAIRSEVERLLMEQPPQALGVELWRMLKSLKANPGPETLHGIYNRAAGLNPLHQREELKEGILRIMVAARYQVDFRSIQAERDRS